MERIECVERLCGGSFPGTKTAISGCKGSLEKKWKTKGDYEMVRIFELFYFKFSNEEDKRKVLENSPIYIAGNASLLPVDGILRRERIRLKAIPIWANLYNVCGRSYGFGEEFWDS
ncbi:hypothetical protein IFM89_028984 [Coptis chinensis]|uniref:DUF4283 domain-containing protein n=1 Tax=Coptis chinensis TaxID=261450 RepID=A0A835M1I5_9MAGN|nr:hypothetical protein IFM89_028984 [Coptis chinensis]